MPAVVPAPVRFSLPTLFLKRHEERRLRAGHLWVYSNEVDTHRSPLGEFEPGELIEIRNSRDQALGTGYINPHSLICARLVSRDPHRLLDRSLLRERLHLARDLRERLYGKPFYRLVFGESDGLPGLVVDRYGEVLVVQTTTAGMERCRDEVIAVLDELIRPAALVLRNDSPVRAMERLATYVETVLGSLPEAVSMEENGVRFTFSAQEGQKTGWFYDQRDNRARLARYVHQRRVLDLFSYVGAWGVQAAVAGARETLCVDASAQALKRLKTNAVENG
jgi:Predicted SAM-dependent methyltransferases